MLRTVIVAVCALSLIACTTTYHTRTPSPEVAQQSLQIGQDVSLLLADGRSVALRVTAITKSHVHGTENSQPRSIALADIREIRRDEVSGAKTTAAITVGSVLAWTGLIFLAGWFVESLLESSAEDRE